MKQKILLTIFALWLLVTVSSKQIFALSETLSAAQDAVPTSTAETAVSMVDRINTYRSELDLPVYYQDQALAQAAQQLADTMAATEFISHYDESGANPQQRAENAGYSEHVTEIIFGGFGGAAAAWEWWADNELHHGLLISEDYVEFGVATAVSEQSGRQYWAVMFGLGDGRYEIEGLNNETSVVTKLPSATSTAIVTAVVSTATTQPEPTATNEQLLLIADNKSTPSVPIIAQNPENNVTNDTTNSVASNNLEESKWLILAAVGTIIFSIAVFYFPRHGLSQKFKE